MWRVLAIGLDRARVIRILKVVIWGGNGKRGGKNDEVEEVTVCLNYGTHLNPSHSLQLSFIQRKR